MNSEDFFTAFLSSGRIDYYLCYRELYLAESSYSDIKEGSR